MKPTSYKIHLPNDSTINAKDSHNLDLILSLNVCRMYEAEQIRIEPVWVSRDPGEALGVRRVPTSNKLNEFRAALRRHENDCHCEECTDI